MLNESAQRHVPAIGNTVRWEHAHQCRKCGHAVRIDDIDPRIIATGVMTCPKCEMTGPINVAIVQANS